MMRADLTGAVRLASGGSGPYAEICVAVDDTDDMTRKTSTGEIAEAIACGVSRLGGQLLLQITRHQLLVRDDIPYTSHNSAMAFKAMLPEGKLPLVYGMAAQTVRTMRAATSDPGLCIAVLPSEGTAADRAPDRLKHGPNLRRYGPDAVLRSTVSLAEGRGLSEAGAQGEAGTQTQAQAEGHGQTGTRAEGQAEGHGQTGTRAEGHGRAAMQTQAEAHRRALIDFGQRAKVEFCSIEEAYRLAESIPWVTLSSLGGDESGVVGALAGVGLRLAGDDGRFRGKWDLAKLCDGIAEPCAGLVAARLSRRFNGPVLMVDVDGGELPASTRFAFDGEVKPILFSNSLTVVCEIRDGKAHPCRKVDLGTIGNKTGDWSRVCEAFAWDNDGEERLDGTPSCANCLYRRWTARGFTCVKDAERRPPSMT